MALNISLLKKRVFVKIFFFVFFSSSLLEKMKSYSVLLRFLLEASYNYCNISFIREIYMTMNVIQNLENVNIFFAPNQNHTVAILSFRLECILCYMWIQSGPKKKIARNYIQYRGRIFHLTSIITARSGAFKILNWKGNGIIEMVSRRRFKSWH